MTKDNKKGFEIVKGEKITDREIMRKSFVDVFNKLGGINHLLTFAEENPKQFYTLMVKLFPTPKDNNKQGDNIPKHETFIQMIVNENNQLTNDINKPYNIIELPIEKTNVT